MAALKASLGKGRPAAKAATESADAAPIASLAKAAEAEGVLERKPARRANATEDAGPGAKVEARKRAE